jgi:hypothetical protein
MTARAKILQYMKKRGFITKAIISGYNWSYGAGDHILHLRKRFNIETEMRVNSKTGGRFAVYHYRGKL